MLEKVLADITLSPIVTVRSGIPFTLRIGTDVNGDTHALYDRPFQAARNTGRGAKFAAFNMRLNKQFYIDRDNGTRVEFIVEGANLLNRTNFTSVNDVIGRTSPLLFGPFDQEGSSDLSRTTPLGFTSAAPGRQIQFGLKIAF
jgi:hypothetical protein